MTNIIYKGVFLNEQSKELLWKRGGLLTYKVSNLHVTFEFKPKKPFPSDILGKTVRLKVVGEGNDGVNHGYLVELSDEVKEYYAGAEQVHITVSLASRQTNPVDTGKLQFTPITPFIVHGKMGHYLKGQRINYGEEKR